MSKRYIDADALKADLTQAKLAAGTLMSCEVQKMMSFIDEQPTADVVEVVRCKECVFFENENPCGIVDWWNNPDDFCSKGKRRA